MEKTKNMFLTSAKELKTTSTLAVCAMLAALALILNSVASINIGPYVKIGFSGIPNQIADYLFGPVTGCLFAGVLDIVKFFIRPDGPFFFGFTFNAMLAAFIYGCFYYKHKLTFRRVLIAKLVVVLIVSLRGLVNSSGDVIMKMDFLTSKIRREPEAEVGFHKIQKKERIKNGKSIDQPFQIFTGRRRNEKHRNLCSELRKESPGSDQ